MQLTFSKRLLFQKSLLVFIFCNVVSFLNTIVPIFPGVLISALCVFLLLLHYVSLMGFLSNKQNALFILYCLSQVVSVTYLILTPISFDFLKLHPTLFFESLSYIFIPQLFFYFLGFMTGKLGYAEKSIIKIYWINFYGFFVGLYLHFFRPSFYQDFIDTVFEGIFDTSSILPRFNGYLSSMILGMLCSLNFVLTFNIIKDYKKQMLMVFFLLVLSILIFQRGAWLSIGLGAVIMISLNLKNFFFQRRLKLSMVKLKIIAAYILFLTVACSLLLFFAFKFDLFSLFTFDLLERLTNPEDAVAERSFLWENTIQLMKKYPYGIGFGMLTHKSADLNFNYAVPDGNYFRILGESGFISLILFMILALNGIYKLCKANRVLWALGLFLFLIQGIGTNVFDLYYCSFIFWFILGISYSTSSNNFNADKKRYFGLSTV